MCSCNKGPLQDNTACTRSSALVEEPRDWSLMDGPWPWFWGYVIDAVFLWAVASPDVNHSTLQPLSNFLLSIQYWQNNLISLVLKTRELCSHETHRKWLLLVTTSARSADWLRFYARSIRHKTTHFGDVLSSQSLKSGMVNVRRGNCS